jgi:hypothetical protein
MAVDRIRLAEIESGSFRGRLAVQQVMNVGSAGRD